MSSASATVCARSLPTAAASASMSVVRGSSKLVPNGTRMIFSRLSPPNLIDFLVTARLTARARRLCSSSAASAALAVSADHSSLGMRGEGIIRSLRLRLHCLRFADHLDPLALDRHLRHRVLEQVLELLGPVDGLARVTRVDGDLHEDRETHGGLTSSWSLRHPPRLRRRLVHGERWGHLGGRFREWLLCGLR